MQTQAGRTWGGCLQQPARIVLSVFSPSPQISALCLAPKCLVIALREHQASKSPRSEAHPGQPPERAGVASITFLIQPLLAYLPGWGTHSLPGSQFPLLCPPAALHWPSFALHGHTEWFCPGKSPCIMRTPPPRMSSAHCIPPEPHPPLPPHASWLVFRFCGESGKTMKPGSTLPTKQ